MSANSRLCIYVSGGVVQSVETDNHKIDIFLADADNAEAGGPVLVAYEPDFVDSETAKSWVRKAACSLRQHPKPRCIECRTALYRGYCTEESCPNMDYQGKRDFSYITDNAVVTNRRTAKLERDSQRDV